MIPVVLFHANLGASGGYVGVDVFFVISGFLITSLMVKELDAHCFSIVDFWERRIRRIFPVLAVMVAVVLLAGYLILLPARLAELGKSSMAQALLVANIYFWRDVGYFSAPAAQKPLLHTWSLAVEEQFYLLFPLVLCILGERRRQYTTALLALIAMLSFAASLYGVYRHPAASFFLLPTRAWELLVGSLLALVPGSLRFPNVVNQMMACLAIFAIAFAVFVYDDRTPFPGLAAILPVGGAAAFILANTHDTTALGRLLSVAPLVFVGQISYSLYLWHWPILAFFSCTVGEVRGWRLSVAAVSMSFVLAVLSWRFVERPFRRRSAAPMRRAVFVGALTIVTLFVGVSSLFWITNGLPSRFSPAVLQVVSDIEHRNTEYESFIDELQTGHLPLLGRNEPSAVSVDFALFGDSHAVALAPLFDIVARQHDLAGLVVARRGILVAKRDDISRRNQLFLDTLRRRRIKNVIIVGRWDAYVGSDESVVDLLAMLRLMENVGVECVFLFRQVPTQPFGSAFSQQIFLSVQFPSFFQLRSTSAKDYIPQFANESRFFEKLQDFQSLQVDVIDTSIHCFDETGKSRVVELGRRSTAMIIIYRISVRGCLWAIRSRQYFHKLQAAEIPHFEWGIFDTSLEAKNRTGHLPTNSPILRPSVTFRAAPFLILPEARGPECRNAWPPATVQSAVRVELRELSLRSSCSSRDLHRGASRPRHRAASVFPGLATATPSRTPPETATAWHCRRPQRCVRWPVVARYPDRSDHARAWGRPGRPVPSGSVAARLRSGASTIQSTNRDGRRSITSRCPWEACSRRDWRSSLRLIGRNLPPSVPNPSRM